MQVPSIVLQPGSAQSAKRLDGEGIIHCGRRRHYRIEVHELRVYLIIVVILTTFYIIIYI